MEPQRDRMATLQRESKSIKEFLLGISAEALEQQSACERWTVADVLSHVGSQMFVLSITRGLAGDVSPPGRPAVSEHNEDDFAEGIAQRAFATRAQQGDGLLAWFMGNLDESVKVFDSVEPDQWNTQCYWPPGPEPISTLLDMRIAELCMHAWDVRSVLEANYHLSEDSLRTLIDTVPRAVRGAFRPEPGLKTPVRYRFSTPAPTAHEIDILVTKEGTRLESPSSSAADVNFRCDDETYVLVMYGRVTPDEAMANGRLTFEGGRSGNPVWAALQGRVGCRRISDLRPLMEQVLSRREILKA